nr:FixH family protein [Bacteroidota bacterium]
MKFNWGTGIVLVIIVFILGMAVMVFIAFRQNINLVHEDYYPKEIEHQQQIDKRKNARDLKEQITIKYTNDTIGIGFPSIFEYDKLLGKILLFRPSDNKKDILLQLALNKTGKQFVSTSGMEKGKYIVQVEWVYRDVWYYFEKDIHVK